jgi:DNA-binding NarL/FixJ family response regulator
MSSATGEQSTGQGHQRPVTRIIRLTPRESQVLDAFMIDGADNPTIARRLMIRPATAKTHMKNILRAFDVGNRTALALEVERGHARVATISLRTPLK